ncbi:hypothetical protein VNO78_24016 [Psophocarpus tetragonolobus]|uniref:Uncharacterized protein n=1 Tax=Psophocarpus tetragonolobus TaxID=3891 RepID=A0AAN9S522_PSOTE
MLYLGMKSIMPWKALHNIIKNDSVHREKHSVPCGKCYSTSLKAIKYTIESDDALWNAKPYIMENFMEHRGKRFKTSWKAIWYATKSKRALWQVLSSTENKRMYYIHHRKLWGFAMGSEGTLRKVLGCIVEIYILQCIKRYEKLQNSLSTLKNVILHYGKRYRTSRKVVMHHGKIFGTLVKVMLHHEMQSDILWNIMENNLEHCEK